MPHPRVLGMVLGIVLSVRRPRADSHPGAQGRYHSRDGLLLENLAFKSGDAGLSVSGALLGPRQDATGLLEPREPRSL